jgi:hypothetical protein
MVVRADLDRPVAGVGDGERDGRAAGVELDLAGGRHDLTWDHRGDFLYDAGARKRSEPWPTMRSS